VDHLVPALWLVTDRRLSSRPLPDVVEECLAAGLRAVQLREKDLSTRDLMALAEPLRESTRRHGARLVINDRLDVALGLGADGVQRTGHSLPVAVLRRLAGPGLLVGASVHALDEARQAEADGASFVIFGPVYDTASKRPYGAPQGVEALGRVAGALRIPVLAVGGIDPGRAADVISVGAAGVAAIGAFLSAERPADVVKRFLDVLGRA
jgi:thiamine-phosphate pyrophosphorylase